MCRDRPHPFHTSEVHCGISESSWERPLWYIYELFVSRLRQLLTSPSPLRTNYGCSAEAHRHAHCVCLGYAFHCSFLFPLDCLTLYGEPGHARPLVHLSARLVKLRPINVTILTSTAYYPRITTELARSFDPEEEEYAKRIRFVCYQALPLVL